MAYRVSAEKSADRLMGVPLCVTCFFFLAAFNICSLSLIFAILIIMCLGVFLSWVNPVWDSPYLLHLDVCFLSQVRDVFSYYVFKYILSPFVSLFSFWDPYYANISALDVVPEVSLKLSSFLFILFFSVQCQ